MIYSSNHLEKLCQIMADNIGQPGSDVFGKEFIVTPTAGMNAWLKTELAQRNSIFANFEFMNQDGLLSAVSRVISGDRTQNNTDIIRYKIFTLLDSADFKTEFSEVSDYYEGSELRRIQLAGRIADLFDQYQLYRPEMINDWDEGNLSSDSPLSEKWQMWLWVKLNIESRATKRDKVISELKVKRELIKKAFPRISMFGITIVTKFHLEFISELTKYTDVDIYLCLPTDQKKFRNELLISFGSKASELADMVVEKFGELNYIKEMNAGAGTLAAIQNEILINADDLKFEDDGSVQINSCYTPVREVECLYNYLLDLFEKDRKENKGKGSIKPADILVIATDINIYAPFIKAVFNYAPVKIPFQISGAATNSEDSILSALEQILNFTEDDLTSEKVISLLEQNRVKHKYGIRDCNYLRSVIRKANIRFGRINRAEDDTLYVSWKYGLEKILLGYAMLAEENEEYKSEENITLLPFKDAEASGSYDVFRLKAFVEKLESLIDEQKKERTPAEWKLFLFGEVIENMIYRDDSDKEDRAELSSIYRTLSFIDNLGFDEKVPFEVFMEELSSRLFSDSKDMKLNTGRVTVSSPIPVRGIPFKIICFLGLNNGVFPGNDNFMGFDLLGEEYKKGDRSKKETDKYLFLDTILAARDKLYLSFIGQSAKDNTEIPPSIVLDIFIDYLNSERAVIRHPLHGFSSRYHFDDNRLFTYLYGQNNEGYTFKEKQENEVSEVYVKSLVDFFQAPVDWYFKTVLDINYDDTDNTISETELFELDNLQKWIIKKELLKHGEDETEAFIIRGKKEGFLPLKSAAVNEIENIKKDIELIKPVFQKLVGSRQEKKIVVNTVLDTIKISGTIDGIYDDELIMISLSKYPLKYKIEAYVISLLLFAEGKIKSAKFLDIEGNLSSIPADAGSAKSALKALLEYYMEGTKTPLLFTIRAAEKAAETEAEKASSAYKKVKTESEQILESFMDEIFPNERTNYPANRYLQILFRENKFENFGEKEVETIKDLSSKLKLNQF
jgi:exodeoxyribonuclease V gamma subunit